MNNDAYFNACQHGNSDVVKEFLRGYQHNVKMHALLLRGLHWACKCQRIEIVDLFLKSGYVRDYQIALELTCATGNLNVYRAIISSMSARRNKKYFMSINQNKCIERAIIGSNVDIIFDLLEWGKYISGPLRCWAYTFKYFKTHIFEIAAEHAPFKVDLMLALVEKFFTIVYERDKFMYMVLRYAAVEANVEGIDVFFEKLVQNCVYARRNINWYSLLVDVIEPKTKINSMKPIKCIINVLHNVEQSKSAGRNWLRTQFKNIVAALQYLYQSPDNLKKMFRVIAYFILFGIHNFESIRLLEIVQYLMNRRVIPKKLKYNNLRGTQFLRHFQSQHLNRKCNQKIFYNLCLRCFVCKDVAYFSACFVNY